MLQRIRNYFDLNKRVERNDLLELEKMLESTKDAKPPQLDIMNEEVEQGEEGVFHAMGSLGTQTIKGPIIATANVGLETGSEMLLPKRMTWWEQAVMYLGVVVGILFSSVADQFKNGQALHFHFSWSVLAASMFIALIIIPLVFEKLKVQADSPFIVRLGLFVQNGVFWQVVIGVVAKGMS